MGSGENMTNYPQRPGEPDCRDFLRMGRCKYGESCKYHHPLGGAKAADPNEPPFPIRPDEPTCQYYLKNGTCKFGQTCKFHHPPHMRVPKPSSTNSNIGTQPLVVSLNQRLEHTTNGLSGGEEVIVNHNHNHNHGHNHNQNHNHNHPHNITNDRSHREGREVLPQRPGEPDCIYFLRNSRCKYGTTCKYHHPRNVNANGNVNVNSGKDNYIPSNRVPVPGPNGVSLYPRERSVSESMADVHDGQSFMGTNLMPRQQSSLPLSSPFLHESVHRKLRARSGLGTINNSYQQYPQGNGAMKTMGGNFHSFSNVPTSPTVGSPCMSSSTVASSYDTSVTSETLPPAVRVQGQSTSLMSSSSPLQGKGMHTNRTSFSDLPKSNLQTQLNNSNIGGQFNIYRTNSTDEIASSQLCPPVTGMGIGTNANDGSRTHNSRHLNEAAHQNQQHWLSRHPMSMSSNTSIASLSPTGEYSDNFSAEQIHSGPQFPFMKHNRNVDDGLSQMTDALLTMLDTPDERSQQHQYDYKDKREIDPTRSGPSAPMSSNSLPEYLLSNNSSRANQMNPLVFQSNFGRNVNMGLYQESEQGSMPMLGQGHQSRIVNNRDRVLPKPVVDSSSSGRPPTHFYIQS